MMSRSFFAAMVVFCLAICPLSIGCGGSGPEVIEQTTSEAELQAEQEAYEKEMAQSGSQEDGD